MAPLASMAMPILYSGLRKVAAAAPVIAGASLGMYAGIKGTHRLMDPGHQVPGSQREAVARRVYAWVPAVAGGALLWSTGRGMAAEAGRWTLGARTMRLSGIGAIGGAALVTGLLAGPISLGSHLAGQSGTRLFKAVAPDWLQTTAATNHQALEAVSSVVAGAGNVLGKLNGGGVQKVEHKHYTIDLKPGEAFDAKRDLRLKMQPGHNSLDTIDSFTVR